MMPDFDKDFGERLASAVNATTRQEIINLWAERETLIAKNRTLQRRITELEKQLSVSKKWSKLWRNATKRWFEQSLKLQAELSQSGDK